MTVVIGIQDRQARVLQDIQELQREQARVQLIQAQELDALRTMLAEGLRNHEQRMADVDGKLAVLTEKAAESEEKLNALIQIVDGVIRRPPEPGKP